MNKKPEQPKKPKYWDTSEAERDAQMVEKQAVKNITTPFDSLDAQYKQTEPAYGKEASPQFYERLKKIKGAAIPLWNANGTPQLDKYGQQIHAVTYDHLYDVLAYFTRDIRLGNLSGSDLKYCEYYLKIAGDCLRMGLIESFLTAYSYCATRLELSQSKNGFFRKNQNTVTTQRVNTDRVEKAGMFKTDGEG
jgi:hypothetical protein